MHTQGKDGRDGRDGINGNGMKVALMLKRNKAFSAIIKSPIDNKVFLESKMNKPEGNFQEHRTKG